MGQIVFLVLPGRLIDTRLDSTRPELSRVFARADQWFGSGDITCGAFAGRFFIVLRHKHKVNLGGFRNHYTSAMG